MSTIKERDRAQYANDACDLYTTTPPFPTNMMVEATNMCNHRCVFCANKTATRKRRHLDITLLKSILRQGADLGAREVGFYSTGEPLMYPELLNAVRAAKDAGFTYIYLSTNGALATPERIQPLVEAGLASIKFSVNSDSRERYAQVHGKDDFELVKANISQLNQYRHAGKRSLYLATSSVLFPDDHDAFARIQEIFAPIVDETLCYDVGNQGGYSVAQPGNKCTSSTLYPEKTCSLPFNRIHITCEGYLTVCCVDYQNYLALADLNTLSLKQAWHSEVFQNIRRRHLADSLEGTMCARCRAGSTLPAEPLCPELATSVNLQATYDLK